MWGGLGTGGWLSEVEVEREGWKEEARGRGDRLCSGLG